MKLTVLGGCGAWPMVEQACSGYLLEQGPFRLLIDPGYAVLPALLKVCRATDVNAVLVSHGHPDHCADLNPLLRALVLGDQPRSVLQVFAPKGALDRILTLDQVRSVAKAADVNRLDDGSSLRLGPFTVEST
ncbi:MAG: MBL fold metallo-hydrolase, partial [Propionibacteriaceae bacterium]|nr:MBL fold metallo-hydrolase [Propionibacteriaceae bacterium]